MSGAAAVSDTRRESSSGQGRLDNGITRGSDTIMDVDISWIACPFCTNYRKGGKNPSILWWVIQHLLWPTTRWYLPLKDQDSIQYSMFSTFLQALTFTRIKLILPFEEGFFSEKVSHLITTDLCTSVQSVLNYTAPMAVKWERSEKDWVIKDN